MNRILILSFIALAAFSCKKDDTIRYNNITMGNIEGETIISDQGNTFDVTEKLYEVDLSALHRVILSCDVLKKTAENRYDIRLTDIAPVLTKAPVYLSTIIPGQEASVEAPVIIRELWYGGGYINMGVQIAKKTDSEEKHVINLVYDDSSPAEEGSEEGYTFILRHNALGHVPTEEDIDTYEVTMGYVSFPIAGLIKEDRAKITLKWNAHPFKDGRYDYLGSEVISKTYDWARVGFEQNASAPTSPSLTGCKSFSAR